MIAEDQRNFYTRPKQFKLILWYKPLIIQHSGNFGIARIPNNWADLQVVSRWLRIKLLVADLCRSQMIQCLI